MCKIPCVFQMTSKNADMLAEPMKIWSTSLMGPTEKISLLPCHLYLLFLLFSSPSLQHSHHFSHSAFFPSLPIWSAFILWDWGREAVTGWNAWANAVFHVRKGAAPGVCVCVTCVASEAKDMSPTYVAFVVSIG